MTKLEPFSSFYKVDISSGSNVTVNCACLCVVVKTHVYFRAISKPKVPFLNILLLIHDLRERKSISISCCFHRVNQLCNMFTPLSGVLLSSIYKTVFVCMCCITWFTLFAASWVFFIIFFITCERFGDHLLKNRDGDKISLLSFCVNKQCLTTFPDEHVAFLMRLFFALSFRSPRDILRWVMRGRGAFPRHAQEFFPHSQRHLTTALDCTASENQ